jgi:hypothetical protein
VNISGWVCCCASKRRIKINKFQGDASIYAAAALAIKVTHFYGFMTSIID